MAGDGITIGENAADAAGLHGGGGGDEGWGDQLGIPGGSSMSDWEWIISSEDLRGQVEVIEVVGDGVEGLCLRGIGVVPRSEWEQGKAGVGPS